MKPTSTTYRIFAILMAFLMFFSSVGLLVDMHYCQGQLKTISFFGKAKSCHDIGQGMKNCPHHKKMMATQKLDNNPSDKKDCCSNKLVYLEFDEDQQYQVDNALLATTQIQHFVIAFVEVFLGISIAEIENPSYVYYESPLISRDIYVLLETYLL